MLSTKPSDGSNVIYSYQFFFHYFVSITYIYDIWKTYLYAPEYKSVTGINFWTVWDKNLTERLNVVIHSFISQIMHTRSYFVSQDVAHKVNTLWAKSWLIRSFCVNSTHFYTWLITPIENPWLVILCIRLFYGSHSL